MHSIALFSIFLCVPFLFFRIVLRVASKREGVKLPHVREGRKFHHLHFGVGILFVGLLSFLILGVTRFSVIVSAIGFGMIADIFIASLYIPEPEPQTTQLYFGTFYSTALLLLCMLMCIAIVTILVNRY